MTSKSGPSSVCETSAGVRTAATVARVSRRGSAMRSWGSEVQEANLAWAVAEAVKPYLSAVVRDAVFVAIGAGDTCAAIRGLLRSVEIKRIPLRPDLLHQCRTWLRGYGGHDGERDLRHLIEKPLLPHLIGAAATTPLTRVPPTPKPRGWLRFEAPQHTDDKPAVQSRCITGCFADRRETG
jgi:hypothetical protein